MYELVALIGSVSVSGGVDSAVTLGLMKYAMNMENSPIQRILGISQPIHSSQWAYDRAMVCGKELGVEMIVVDQTPVFDALVLDSNDDSLENIGRWRCSN